MNRFFLRATLSMSLFISACATTPITESGKRVRFIKGDPPAGCMELGSVESSDSQFWNACDQVSLKNRMINKAAEMGGNVVRWDMSNESMFMRTSCTANGTVFKCK